ncbi:hypothetical protein SAY86_012403 [Trapa natans]|uniref:3'(2'),5'-bisphosphate nucleotidase n=1 Tax=Trapa natans TaxID=22666 RepID=A0AAN7LXX6_TRANT|nr:hypothetical protein SAY86_012403 [Trapa natans]
MAVLHLHSASHISSIVRHSPPRPSWSPARRSTHAVKSLGSCLPFPVERAEYHSELVAAIDVVERACRLCIDVKRSLISNDGRILEKNDQTPVTVADFGVQALVSLELSKLFPSIPLVAEEDSSAIRSNNLADVVVDVVKSKASSDDNLLTKDDILKAIDRGRNAAYSFGAQPATYWILDPIDGTRGFLRGSESLYVVGLALVVKGEIALGVMGCPNWQEDLSLVSRRGMIMVSHIGYGTWTKRLPYSLEGTNKVPEYWTRCFVDTFRSMKEARFCISDSQTWESLPLSASYIAKYEAGALNEDEILLLPTCCGSLCKYMMVASGKASVFILRTRAEKTIKAWDHAVGMICVHEAGGKVTDWKGSSIDLAADLAGRRIIFPAGGVLITNSSVHDKILDMISPNSSTM